MISDAKIMANMNMVKGCLCTSLYTDSFINNETQNTFHFN